MRSVIIDFARKRQTERRGGDCAQVTLTTQIAGAALSAEQEIVRVHEALEQLAQVDPRMAQVVEMKYFAGLTEVEIAQALGVTDRTVRRDWEQARLFLAEVLAESLR
jgi:RNA polymerase sigma factor (TIGR02999 family)